MFNPDPMSAESKTFRTPAGTMAYTDVGQGPPIVFLHGNPTNAHLYRHLIRALAPRHRCIAPDYLGFGRSDAPTDCSYRPPLHASLIEGLLSHLNLTHVTLVLHDWGGPIGLSYAVRHPDTVQRLILMNTWAWPLTHRPLIRLFSRAIDTSAGRFSVERLNAFARVLMPLTCGTYSCASTDWIQSYADALDSRPRRYACWMLARSLVGETEWLRALWTHRSHLEKPAVLLCWGMADPAFGTESTLARWHSLFPHASLDRRSKVGHYLPEELGKTLVSPVTNFLRKTSP